MRTLTGFVALATLACAHRYPAKHPEAASAPAACVTLREIPSSDPDGGRRTFTLADAAGEQEWMLVWATDLNADGLEDLALEMPASGSTAGTMQGVWAACGGGAFVNVVGPDYVWRIEVAPTVTRTAGGETWRDLSVEIATQDENARKGVATQVVRFDGVAYATIHR
jgi:hypothetical protein